MDVMAASVVDNALASLLIQDITLEDVKVQFTLLQKEVSLTPSGVSSDSFGFHFNRLSDIRIYIFFVLPPAMQFDVNIILFVVLKS